MSKTNHYIFHNAYKKVFSVFVILLTLASCQKRDYVMEDRMTVQGKEVSGAARWYNSQLLPGVRDTGFVSQNHPDWSQATLTSKGPTQILTTPVYHKDSVRREVAIELTDSVYTGVIKERNHISSSFTTLKTYSINGKLIEEGYVNNTGNYHMTRSYEKELMGRNLRVMGVGDESGGGDPAKAMLEMQDNARIMNLLQQEDARDDAGMTPCHGTGRSGNLRWNGTLEHWLIQIDYLTRNPTGAFREYFVPGSSSQQNGRPGYADIANSSTSEMFEIKPDNQTGITAGQTEVQIYVTQANLLCPLNNGVSWHPGTNYAARNLIDPRNPLNVIVARLASNGVIVYRSQGRNGSPVPSPVVLPQNLYDKLKNLLRDVVGSTSSVMQQQILTFLRANPDIVPYLKGAAAVIVIGTIIEDIATEGIGIADDWQSFLVARTLWRASSEIVLY